MGNHQDRIAMKQAIDKWLVFLNRPGNTKFVAEAIIDETNDRYALVIVGWDDDRRISSLLFHVDIVDGKFWIQQDNTEEGIATELLAAGIPKDRIVLAFYPTKMRKWGAFAVA